MKIFVIVVLTLLATLAYAKSNTCILESENKFYDLNPLQQATDITIQGQGFYDFTLNFCKPTQLKCDGSTGHPLLHVHWQNPDECNYISGKITKQDVEIKENQHGVSLMYKNGQRFNQGGSMLGSESYIHLECDKDTELSLVSFISMVEYSGVMRYNFHAKSRHACGKENPQRDLPECVLTGSSSTTNKQWKMDLNKLRTTDGYNVRNGKFNYKFNVCSSGGVPSCRSTKAPSVIEVDNSCVIAGGSLSGENIVVRTIEGTPSLGAIIEYRNGQNITPGLRYGTKLLLICDPTKKDETLKFEMINSETRDGHLFSVFRAATSLACPT